MLESCSILMYGWAPSPRGQLGVSDSLLTCSSAALQVDKWTDCPPKPGCITVNVGDPLQFWSDGVLKSNYHRVRMPKEGEPLVRPRIASRRSHTVPGVCSKCSREPIMHPLLLVPQT